MYQGSTAPFTLGLFELLLPTFPSVHQNCHWALSYPLATYDQVLSAAQLAVPWWQEHVGPHGDNCLWFQVWGSCVHL